MRPAARALAVALPATFLLAFVLSPGPTGVVPVVGGLLGTVALGAVVYTRLD
ncbi:hypothetical protein [Halorarius litoreus]|uniref:hypothetical protein n=1 Tax=Halorarius litoreus TaxID=2962676 RepID=UPI0020CD4909|nr:hypothetical protein [Halorarius litoreus]